MLASGELLLSVNILMNKWWVRPVPAAAVTPAPRVAIAFIWPKASVVDNASLLLNPCAQHRGRKRYYIVRDREETKVFLG